MVKKLKYKQFDEQVNVNTATKVQTDSKLKRSKLDEAVKKILLFKDMKTSTNKGDLDPNVKVNQEFIKDTI